MNNTSKSVLTAFVRTERLGPNLMRIAIAVVFMWIGALKFVSYEADSITPFVANSPVMSFFYNHPTEYKAHLTHEGQMVPELREWQTANNTYGFSTGLGIVEWAIAILVLAYPVSKRAALLGAFLSFATTLVTLSFLFTTPEAWVPALGDAQHGFPYLSGAGRLVLKDTMMLAGSWIIGVDAAKAILARREAPVRDEHPVEVTPARISGA
ncbi:reactive chlorine resistance membrane protein RclC [Luteibacter yeojuensis]